MDAVMALWFPLAADTPVWTTTGFKTMGTMAVGDHVATASGGTAGVVAVTPLRREPVFQVSFSDGSTIRATTEHHWWVRRHRNGVTHPPEWMTTAQMASHPDRLSVDPPLPFDCPETELDLDPYVLGMWLGNGDARQGTIYQEHGDIGELRAAVEACGYSTSAHAHPQRFGILGIRGILSGLGVLGDKHVPEQYLGGSLKQRLGLLQGLMDTDGSVHNVGRAGGRCTFGNTNANLVHAVERLALSLGFRPNTQFAAAGEAPTPGGGVSSTKPFWRVNFTANAATLTPFRLARKAQRTEAPMRRKFLVVTGIAPAGTTDTRCITVDHPSHVFLAGERMVPTGNCWLRWREMTQTGRINAGTQAQFHRTGLGWTPTRSLAGSR
jgi:hypothetical protein